MHCSFLVLATAHETGPVYRVTLAIRYCIHIALLPVLLYIVTNYCLLCCTRCCCMSSVLSAAMLFYYRCISTSAISAWYWWPSIHLYTCSSIYIVCKLASCGLTVMKRVTHQSYLISATNMHFSIHRYTDRLWRVLTSRAGALCTERQCSTAQEPYWWTYWS